MQQSYFTRIAESSQRERNSHADSIAAPWDERYRREEKSMLDLVIHGGDAFRCPLVTTCSALKGFEYSRWSLFERLTGDARFPALHDAISKLASNGTRSIFLLEPHEGMGSAVFYRDTRDRSDRRTPFTREAGLVGREDLFVVDRAVVADAFWSRIRNSLHVHCLDLGLRVETPTNSLGTSLKISW